MNEDEWGARIAGRIASRSRHVCAFFQNAEEENGILLPFIKEGFAHGDRALHIVDPALRGAHMRLLEEAGIEAAAAERSGQLEVRDWEETYLRGGRFDKDAMLALIEEALRRTRADGYARTRMVGHMEWALEDRPGVVDLVEFEARVNYLYAKHADPAAWAI
jgi:hypothetical protein